MRGWFGCPDGPAGRECPVFGGVNDGHSVVIERDFFGRHVISGGRSAGSQAGLFLRGQEDIFQRDRHELLASTVATRLAAGKLGLRNMGAGGASGQKLR